jgi:hypothetical protein
MLRCGLIFFGTKNIKKKLDPGALGLFVKWDPRALDLGLAAMSNPKALGQSDPSFYSF